MDARCSTSSADSARLFARAVLAGMAELALCRNPLAGLVVTACLLPFSVRATAFALFGAVIATLWPFWRQRDVRLLTSGWYGVNGALAGFVVEWHFAHPAGAVLLTALAAWTCAVILDAIVLRLGDSPVGLPPLTLPFLVVGALLSAAAPSLQAGLERADAWLPPPASEVPAASWIAPVPDAGQAERLAQAWQAHARRDYLRAREAFAALTVEAPATAAAWNGLGWSEWGLKNAAAAEAAFARAVALDPGHPYALDGLGWIALGREDFTRAQNRFRAARTGAPGWADPYAGEAWAIYGRGGYAQAKAAFRRALERDPLCADAVAGLGWIALRSGDASGALTLFSQAVAADATAVVGREGLARALLAQHRYADAETAFIDLLDQAPKRAIAGLADTRRLMLLGGEAISVDPREWPALWAALGWTVLALPVVAATVLYLAPAAGTLALALAALVMAATVALAGPCSLLWFDLHLQTVVMIALLMGRTHIAPRWPRPLVAAMAVGAGIAIWAICHRWGVWIPLISFNLAGAAALLLWRVDPNAVLPFGRIGRSYSSNR